MAAKRNVVAKGAKIGVYTRSVDTNRIIRVSSPPVEPTAAEWRQFTFGRLLLFVFNAYETRVLESYRAAGFPEIRQVHFAIMRHIDVNGGTRIGDLAARAGVTKGGMGQLVVEFEALGYIKTAPDPLDARAKRVTLSARGRKLMECTRRETALIERDFAKQIGTKAFAALRSGLVALRETAGP